MSDRKYIVGGGGGKGGGGGSGYRAPVEAPNTLRSKQYARVIDLIGEGECYGLVDGLKSIYLDGTPLQNADSSYNFSDVVVETRTGTQGQSYIPGFPSVEAETAVGVEVKLATPVVRTITDPEVNAVRVTVSSPNISSQDTTTGDLNGYYVPLLIDIQTNGGGYVVRIDDAFSGKTLSGYQRSYELQLSGSQPWDIRVRRQDQESPAANIQNRLFWDSYTEITYAKLAYPNSAVVGVSIDAAQFRAIPVRSFDWKGLLVKIPSNYNPTTRVYTGLWDGTFTTAWTDNPAWCFYDLVTNSRYGLGEFIAEDQVDKWGLYEIAQYCDELVDDGFGGTEPRFTCNLVIQTQTEALNAVANMASVFRGMAYWAGGTMIGVQDAPADPQFLFTNANVIDGLFEREGSSRDARHTVAIVMWNDPDNEYRLVPEYVQDDASIARYGIRPARVTALGCTSRGQANRVGRWLLYSERLETQVLKFSVGMEGVYVAPGAIIQTLDQHRAGARHGGRTVSATTTSLTIDASITIGAGTHTVAVVMPDGTIEERTLTNGAGATTVLTWASALPDTPLVGAIWVVTTPALVPETWRVLAVQETAKNVYAVQAVAHNPSKFDAVEDGLLLEELPTTIIQRVPPAPENLALTDSIRRGKGGDIVTYLTAAWDAVPAASGEIRYEVEWRPENGNWTRVPEIWHTTVDIEGVRDGVLYEVAVYAVNALGYKSLAATDSHTVVGKAALPSDVTGFSVSPQVNSVIIYCNPVPDADLDRIEVRWGDDAVDDWDSATRLANILRGQTTTTAAVPPGLWRFWAKAFDTSGNESLNAVYADADVIQGGAITILRHDDAPEFLGTRTNMGRHYKGYIYPQSNSTAADADWEIFDQHVYDPVASCSYELLEADKGVDAVSRLYLTYSQTAGPGEGAPPTPVTQVDYRLEAGAYDGFEDWTIGSANFRRAKGKLVWTIAGDTFYCDSAVIVADELSIKTEERTDQAVDALGTTVTFTADFNVRPNVRLTLTGGAGAVSTRLTSKTVDDMTIVVFDAGGSQVDGVVDWEAKGP